MNRKGTCLVLGGVSSAEFQMLGISCAVWVILVRISEAGGFSVEIMMRSIDCLCVAIVYGRQSQPMYRAGLLYRTSHLRWKFSTPNFSPRPKCFHTDIVPLICYLASYARVEYR